MSDQKMKREETFVCSFCGAEIPVGVKACPECGSDEQTGWSDDTYLDGVALSDDESYEEIVQREFGCESPPKRRIAALPMAGVAMVLLGLALVGLLAGVIRC